MHCNNFLCPTESQMSVMPKTHICRFILEVADTDEHSSLLRYIIDYVTLNRDHKQGILKGEIWLLSTSTLV